MEADNRVVVDAPLGVSADTVLLALKKRARWIGNHLAAIRARLAHVLRHHNHSARFYKALDVHMPRWRVVKQRLDAMAEHLLPVLRAIQ